MQSETGQDLSKEGGRIPLSGPGERKRIMALVVLALAIVLILGGSWVILSHPKQILYSYIVGVKANNTAVYTLLLPIAVGANGSVSEIMGGLGVSAGSPIVGLEDTGHGQAINVSARGSVRLNAVAKRTLDGPFPPVNLSRHPNGDIDLNMWTNGSSCIEDYGHGCVWFFVNIDSPGQQLDVAVTLTIGDVRHSANLVTSRTGWHAVPVYFDADLP